MRVSVVCLVAFLISLTLAAIVYADPDPEPDPRPDPGGGDKNKPGKTAHFTDHQPGMKMTTGGGGGGHMEIFITHVQDEEQGISKLRKCNVFSCSGVLARKKWGSHQSGDLYSIKSSMHGCRFSQ